MKQSIKERGKLTIFLGAAHGVGKTYAMLEAGHEKMKQGIDVVIACLESPEGLDEFLRAKKIPSIQNVNGKEYKELNIYGVIERKPHLVLVDNLSHLNEPGSCHRYRYQDVNELLEQGIDIFTTLNIQNVESLNDIVAKITEYRVIDKVPDKFIESADQIKLIDISSEELIQRIKDGAVHIPSFTKEETNKFFRPGNINALRELALRFTAQRVDRQLDEYMKSHEIEGPWPASEKILACVSPSPFSSQVIRTARRMATGLKAEWIVAYIETPLRFPNNKTDINQLTSNLRLAEELGAEVINLKSDDVANEIINLAHKKNITQIVVGKPLSNPLKNWWKGSIVDNIILGSKGVSVHIIPGQVIKEENSQKRPSSLKKEDYLKYLGTLLLIGAITIINMFLNPIFDLINIALLYLLPVLFSATYWGRGPSIFASLIGVLAFDVFFVPPVLSLTVDDLRYLLSFLIFLLVAIITSTMAIRLSNQVEIARQRETRTAALYALSRKIVAEDTLDKILNTVCRVVAETFAGEVFILMPDNNNEMVIKGATNAEIIFDEKEFAAARWVLAHGRIAGKSTDTFDNINNLYLPLKSEEEIVGILGVKFHTPEQSMSSEQSELLEAFANLTALAIVRMQLANEAEQARYLTQSERLRTALFNSISHELRTPLASIIGAVTSLLDEGELFSKKDKKSLLSTVNESAQRMNRLVGNLLDMARLESGMMKLKWEWCDLQEIIGVAIRRLQDFLQDRKLVIDLPNNLPLIKVDFTLLEQVLVNLLDNAIKYSPLESEIKISVTIETENIKINIIDKGPGIADDDRERVFDKFYRLYSPQHVTGTGLGLSICKGIIEAHGGSIWVESFDGNGSQFTFTLPLDESSPEIIFSSEEVGERDG
ncbi:MAG: hypothetical protein JM58_12310 [Peptococcaceae bacterium BICA1-8]|nr:MAG: hypothetical protein JM58_12310 [Peptococcaceae bacterium BICA1-8]